MKQYKFIIVFLAIAIGLFLGIRYQQIRNLPQNNVWPEEFSHKEIFYESSNLRIQGFLYKPSGNNLPAILYLHSGTEGFLANWYLEEGKKRGYVFLAINYPGEGKSDGEKENPYQENQAAIDAIAYLKSLHFVNPQKIGVMGSSHGAGIVLKVLESLPLQSAVFAYGGADARELCNYWASRSIKGITAKYCAETPADYFNARSLTRPDVVQTPLLIIHGGRDDLVLVTQSEKLARTLSDLGKIVSLKIYPGASHEFIYEQSDDARDANNEILLWFSKWLK